MALSTLSSVLRCKYKNMVGDYEISYETTQRERERITEVLGIVKKGNLSSVISTLGTKAENLLSWKKVFQTKTVRPYCQLL